MRPPRPPRPATWLLQVLLRGEAREVILGDLEEEFLSVVLPQLGPGAAGRWFWKQAVGSAVARWRRSPAREWFEDFDSRTERSHPRRVEELMRTLMQDLRYGLRLLGKKPAFTTVALLTLTLGIGANAAIFSVVYHVVLRPLPFQDPDTLVTVWENNFQDGTERDDVSPANFLDWRDQQQVFEAMATLNPWSLDYTGPGEPETFRSARVSEGFFEILGIRPWLGRGFEREEHQPGRSAVVLLSHGLWRRRFGGDASIAGRTLSLAGRPRLVAGVLPLDFQYRREGVPIDMWEPQVFDERFRQQRRATYLQVVARLKPGVTRERAQTEMSAIAARLSKEYPEANSGVGATVVPIAEHIVGGVRPAMLILLAAAGFVLLIACANVANLTLARGSARQREIAIRAAMGAGRSRLIGQMLTESLALAVLGGVGGLLLARWAILLIVRLSPGELPRMELVELDTSVVAFAAFVTGVAGLLFGLFPATQFSKPQVHSSLREGAPAPGGAKGARVRGFLVVAEVALALVLLVGAGLLVRSFLGLTRVKPGFAADRIVSLQVFIWTRYSTPEQRAAYFRDGLEKVRSIPGVEAAGITSALPFLDSSADFTLPVTVEGLPAPRPGEETTAQSTIASGQYFPAVGIPLLKGRLFNELDTPQSVNVAIVNEALARRLMPGEDPIGRVLRLPSGQQVVRLEVVGLVGSVRNRLHDEPRPELFRPHSQSPSGSMVFVVRTAGRPEGLIGPLKAAIWEIHRSQPFYRVATMDELIAVSLASGRFNLLLLGFFALVALALSAIGIYGVMSFSTAQRTHEVGVRLVLGAKRTDILGMVLRQGLSLAAAGIALGLAGALTLTRLLESFLFGITPADPLTYATICALLLSVALLACYVPARRATRVDLLNALRYE